MGDEFDVLFYTEKEIAEEEINKIRFSMEKLQQLGFVKDWQTDQLHYYLRSKLL